jgi:shikimate dehydrogenase
VTIKNAWVIGSPISHSLSPAIFQFIARAEKKSLLYQTREVTPEGLAAFLAELRATPEALGTNVTLPLKEVVLPELDDSSGEANAVGAVNVVSVRNGRLFGTNTDVIGIEKTLDERAIKVAAAKCLIFGAGGSAKAVAYVLATRGAAEVFIFNPRSDRGSRLAAELDHSWRPQFKNTQFTAIASLSDLAKTPLALVVNTTPVGMAGSNADVSPELFHPMDRLMFQPGALAFDLIYTPEQTPFLQTAAGLGLKTAGGLGMLVEQALATWEIWLGPPAERDSLRPQLESYLAGILQVRRSRKPIYLTGFMAAGKSEVGKELAALTNRICFDTDQWIQAQARQTIAKIFKSEGETGFREWESRAIEAASKEDNVIVALGGGALGRAENLRRIKERGLLVYLEASPQTLSNRLIQNGWENRPVLSSVNGTDLPQRVEQLLHHRRPIYEQASLTIETDQLSPFEVAQLLLQRLKGQSCLE